MDMPQAREENSKDTRTSLRTRDVKLSCLITASGVRASRCMRTALRHAQTLTRATRSPIVDRSTASFAQRRTHAMAIDAGTGHVGTNGSAPAAFDIPTSHGSFKRTLEPIDVRWSVSLELSDRTRSARRTVSSPGRCGLRAGSLSSRGCASPGSTCRARSPMPTAPSRRRFSTMCAPGRRSPLTAQTGRPHTLEQHVSTPLRLS